MPIREIQCGDCGHIHEDILKAGEQAPNCPQCESSKTVILVSAFGGYQGNMGSGSTRPKNAGSFRRAKR
jgi:putative FmdB family regulatory protein